MDELELEIEMIGEDQDASKVKKPSDYIDSFAKSQFSSNSLPINNLSNATGQFNDKKEMGDVEFTVE